MNVDFRLIAVVATTLLLHVIIAFGFLHHKNAFREEYENQTAALKEQWTQEDKEREQKEQEELTAKFGTTKLDRIALDNRLGLQLVLEKLFGNVFPGYSPAVICDRFTEFSVYLTMPDIGDTKTFAAGLKEVMSRIDPRWVRMVVFKGEKKFRLVDQKKLLAVDWKNADLPEIQRICFPR